MWSYEIWFYGVSSVNEKGYSWRQNVTKDIILRKYSKNANENKRLYVKGDAQKVRTKQRTVP